jgi:hypothetical protein
MVGLSNEGTHHGHSGDPLSFRYRFPLCEQSKGRLLLKVSSRFSFQGPRELCQLQTWEANLS